MVIGGFTIMAIGLFGALFRIFHLENEVQRYYYAHLRERNQHLLTLERLNQARAEAQQTVIQKGNIERENDRLYIENLNLRQEIEQPGLC
jgi:hypothetical protein